MKILRLAAVLLFAFGLALAQVRDPLPVPDVAGYRTLKGDFHMHTVFSDGDVWPVTRTHEAWRDGLDAIAITDHVAYHPHKADVSLDLARPFAIARPAAEQLGLLLVPAVEFSEGDLHANALFVKDPNAFTGLDLAASFKRAREQDAFVFWNHPGWKQTAEWFPPIDAAHKEGLIQGVELVNGPSYYKQAFPWIGEKNLAIFANSDVHRPILPDYGPRQRPITLVFVKSADLDGLREAFLARRTAAWMGGEIWGAERLLKGLWEGAVKVQNAEIRRRTTGLLFRNHSAIPFRVKVAKAPAWLRLRTLEIREERTTGFQVDVGKDAPAGRTVAEVQFEVTNLHTEPARNLIVAVPLTVALQQP